MRAQPLLALALVALVASAGCLAAPPPARASANDPALLEAQTLAFTPVKLIDETRAGGEPVLAFTPAGTLLVAAHPGWTHTRAPPSPELVTPASGQSYLWRSTDNGDTWTPVGLPLAPDGQGPRGLGQGVSDPDLALDAHGRVYLADLEGLAAASVSWSDDDGQTWLLGNDLASTYGPIDRPWLAAHGTDVYLLGNYFLDQRLLKSADRGLTWSQVGSANCGNDLVAYALDDGTLALIVGCETGIDVSTDGGATFVRRDVPRATSWARGMTEPAVDTAGNVYMAWADEEGVWYAGTRDLGRTWTAPVNLAADLPVREGTNIWPWIVAGDEGRIAVAWYGVDDPSGPSRARGDWHVHAAVVADAMGATPHVVAAQATDTPVTQGHVCQSGTICQLDATERGDRRVGDFFEAALDPHGMLHIVFSLARDDSISHPAHVRQTGGPSLRA